MSILHCFFPLHKLSSLLIGSFVVGVVILMPVLATTTEDVAPEPKQTQEVAVETAVTDNVTSVGVEEYDDLTSEGSIISDGEDGIDNGSTEEPSGSDAAITSQLEGVNGASTSTSATTASAVLNPQHVTSTPPVIEKEEKKIELIKEAKEDTEEIKEEEKKEKPKEEPPITKGDIRLRAGKVEDTQEKMYGAEQEEMSEETFFEEDESEPFVPADYIAEPAFVARAIKREIILETSPTHSCKADPFLVDISNEGAADAVLTLLGKGGSSYEVEIGELPSGISVSIDGVETKYKSVSNKTTSIPLTFYSTGDVQTGSFSVSVLYIKDGKSISVCQLNLINSQ